MKHAQEVISATASDGTRVTFTRPISHQRAVVEALEAIGGRPSELVKSISK